jgi:1-acyl-sn-glycerol-3-phosphate acyltransferase
MADAEIIRLSGQPRSKAAKALLAGADRASGERAARRGRATPLIRVNPPNNAASASRGPAAPSRDQAEKASAATIKPAKRAPAKKASAEKVLTKKASGKKVPAAKTPAGKAPAAKVSVMKAPAKKFPAKQAPAKESPATRTPATKVSGKKAKAAQASVRSPDFKSTGPKSLGSKSARRQSFASQSSQGQSAGSESAGSESVGGRSVGSEIPRPTPESAGSNGLSVALAIATQLGETLVNALTDRVRPADIESKLHAGLELISHRLTGDYELDEFGFDPEFAEAVPLSVLLPLYRHWFRVEVRGIEHLPADGGALIVGNHSGTLPLDALMTAVAVHEEHPQRRFLRALGADLIFRTPFLAGLARRSGVTLASNPDAERLLSSGQLVGVWPEGFKGIGKPFTERYKLQRFGRGGFVSAALRTGTPIIPCSIVGAEEIYPIIGNIPSLARLLGLPYVPITPFFPLLGPLGAIPLPSKWLIEFGPPVLTEEFGAAAADDPILVFDLTDQIRQSIQQTLYGLLVRRRSIFF